MIGDKNKNGVDSTHAGTELIIYSVTSKIPYKDLGSGEFIDSLLV